MATAEATRKNTKGTVGKVTQIIGSTFDAEFPENKLPAIYNAVKIESDVKGVKLDLTGEVQQHLGGGRVRCVACFMCSTACPANCIHIVAEESPWDDREKYPKQFDIDELRCIYCGMCEEACPCDAIELTPHYEIVGTSRQEMIFDKAKLLEVFDRTIDEKPM